MRFLFLFAAVPAILGAQNPPDAREIVRRSVELDRKNAELARAYTFLQRQEQRELDRSGKPKNIESKTFDVTLLEGSPYRRLVARDDRPLSAKDQRQEDDKLQKSIEQRKQETPEQKQRRIADWERKQEKQREPLKELPDAFDFKLAGEEGVNGGEAWIIDATPKPGYKPHSQGASFFPKVKARLWIEKRTYQWVKLDMETLDTISLGTILLRIAKGGHLVMEQAYVNQEVWLPKHIDLKASARILLVKGMNAEFRFDFSAYKKFQVDSRVVSIGER